MDVLATRAKRLPLPPHVVWESLAEPDRPFGRPWLHLEPGEVDPRILVAERHARVEWSTLWPDRPDDVIRFDLSPAGNETLLRLTLMTLGEAPAGDRADTLRLRLSELIFRDLRHVHGR